MIKDPLLSYVVELSEQNAAGLKRLVTWVAATTVRHQLDRLCHDVVSFVDNQQSHATMLSGSTQYQRSAQQPQWRI